jgi:membrane-associated protein
VFSREDSWLLNKKHLLEAQRFYDKYGGKTIVIARFVPIVRTFAPFVAGIGRMNYIRFALYNVTGGIAWVLLFLMGGWWFGGRETVQKNFKLVVMAIIVISVLPAAIPILTAWIKNRRKPKLDDEADAGLAVSSAD